jgi:hypothetical protein
MFRNLQVANSLLYFLTRVLIKENIMEDEEKGYAPPNDAPNGTQDAPLLGRARPRQPWGLFAVQRIRTVLQRITPPIVEVEIAEEDAMNEAG